MRHQQRQHHMQQDKDREVSVTSETVYSDKDGRETEWQIRGQTEQGLTGKAIQWRVGLLDNVTHYKEEKKKKKRPNWGLYQKEPLDKEPREELVQGQDLMKPMTQNNGNCGKKNNVYLIFRRKRILHRVN